MFLSKYPISETINEIFLKSGLKTSKFVQHLGYKNINGGVKTLHQWLQFGYSDRYFIRLLKLKFPESIAEIDSALELSYQRQYFDKLKQEQETEPEIIPSGYYIVYKKRRLKLY